MPELNVLVVDDEPAIRQVLSSALSKAGYPLDVEAMLIVEVEGSDQEMDATLARIIAASNNDLQALVEQDRFREDLYHRLNLVTLPIRPVRKRPSDIPLLGSHFLRQSEIELNKAR